MKICHVTSVHPMRDGRIFEKECSSLAKYGYDVYIVGVGVTGEENGVHLVGVEPESKGRFYRIAILDDKIIKKALELNCDIYHFHDPELLRYVDKVKECGHKVVFDSHEDVPRQIYSKDWIPMIARECISSIYEDYEKKVCKRIDRLIVATKKIQDIFFKYQIQSEVIFNYPIIKKYNRIKNENKNNILCFAGGLSESNGIIQLIDAVLGFEDVYLKLAGHFDDLVKKYFFDKKNDRMEYLGMLDRKGVENLYLNSTVGIVADLPTGNNVDGLPIKMFEYMNYGLPIITSNFSIREEIFKKHECGILINPYDKNEYRAAIEEIINNKDYRMKCSINGRKAVIEDYNWNSEEKKLIKLYEGLRND